MENIQSLKFPGVRPEEITPRRLLSIEADAKTVSGAALDVLTAIMYFAPARLSGFNVCQHSTNGCREACLNTAGRGVMTSVQIARLQRTRFFFLNRPAFFLKLEKELAALVQKSRRRNLIAACRLDGTADIPWERIPFTGADGRRYESIIERFKNDVVFYDYTKSIKRARAQPYHITYSLSEHPDSMPAALELLASGVNVAVVFDVPKPHPPGTPLHPLPASYRGFPVFDGNITDVRFMDPVGHWIGLRSTGDALKDKSGFVQAANM